MTNEQKLRKAIVDYFGEAMPNLATGVGTAVFSVQKNPNGDDVVVATIHPKHFEIEILVRRRGR